MLHLELQKEFTVKLPMTSNLHHLTKFLIYFSFIGNYLYT